VHKCPPSEPPGHHSSILSSFSCPWVQHLLIPSPSPVPEQLLQPWLARHSSSCLHCAPLWPLPGQRPAMPPPTRVSCDGIRWVVLGSLRGFCGMRWRHVMSDHRCSSALPGQLAASLLPNAAEPRWMPRSACVAPQLAAPAPAGALGRVAPLAARPRAPAAILLPINSNAPLLCIPLPSLRSPPLSPLQSLTTRTPPASMPAALAAWKTTLSACLPP
jgi:hypothetical protein